MSHPVRAVLFALALVAAVTPARAQEPSRGRHVTKVYQVADLVVPIEDSLNKQAPLERAIQKAIGNFNPDQPVNSGSLASAINTSVAPTKVTMEEKLISLIQNVIKADSWAAVGGTGTIDFMPIGQALVINQTPDVQEQVEQLLNTLRQLQDVQVAVEVRAVSVADSFFENFVLKGSDRSILTDQQAKQMLESFMGDRRTVVLQAPKVTTFDGQRATVQSQDQRSYVTAVKAQQLNGQTVYTPQTENVATGFRMTVRPSVTPDHRSVVLALDAELRELTSNPVPLFPVTTIITPVFEGGSQGQPIPFTQFIQQPTVQTRGVNKVMGIPDGATAFFYGGRATRTEKSVCSTPVLGDIPFIGELFTKRSSYVEGDHLLFFVTPRIVEQQLSAQRPAERLSMPTVVRMPSGEEQSAPRPAQPMPSGPSTCPVTGCPTPACCPLTGCPTPTCCPLTSATPVGFPGCPAPSDIFRVQVDACILKMDPKFFAGPAGAAWADLSPKACADTPCFLSAEEAQRFCKAVCAQTGNEVVSRPKVMTCDGQTAAINIGQDQVYQTGVKLIRREDGSVIPEFCTDRVNQGVLLRITPRASADFKSVHLTAISEVGQMLPGSTEYQVTIKPAGGADDSAQTLTLRQPTRDVQRTEAKVAMLWGRTVVVHFGDADKQHYVLMLTPRPFDPLPAAAMAPPGPCPTTAALAHVMAAPPLPPQQIRSVPVAMQAPLAPACCDQTAGSTWTIAVASPFANGPLPTQPPAPPRSGPMVVRFMGQHPPATGSPGDPQVFMLVAPTTAARPSARPVAAPPMPGEEQTAPPARTMPPAQDLSSPPPAPKKMPPAQELSRGRFSIDLNLRWAGADKAKPMPPAEDLRLTELLTKYRAACASGDTATARTLAAECLAIDPTCFGKK